VASVKPTEARSDMIVVPLAKGCALLLTEPEYLAGIRRGKWWRRREAAAKRRPRP